MNTPIKVSIFCTGIAALGIGVYTQAENVGIGVLDPQAVLHVRGDASGDSDVIFQNLNTLTGDGDQALLMVIDNSDGQRVKTLPMGELGGDQDWMVAETVDAPTNITQDIWTTGKVGIGTIDPALELDVMGDIAATGDIYAGGQFVASTYGQASDRRLKTDIEPYDAGLETLRNMKTVQFRYTGQGLPADTDRPHYGVIAQQLQRIDPNLISSFEPATGDQAFLAVNTTSVIYMLANAIQHLDRTVEQAAAREDELLFENVTLRLQLVDLYERVEALEREGLSPN